MRPALLRLLKRPSAVSILGSLISTPTGIEQLESGNTCFQCHIRRIRQGAKVKRAELESLKYAKRPASPSRTREGHPFSFQVYDIETPHGLQSERKEPSRASDFNQLLASLSLLPERLEFESDIGHRGGIGSRLVDNPTQRHDFSLWSELLRYRQRHYGDQGTMDIFQALTDRVDGVCLPVGGELADFFWHSFVELGLRRERILERLVDYAQRIWNEERKRWPKLYESILSDFFLRGMPQLAVKWHNRLWSIGFCCEHDIAQILEPALSIQANKQSVPTKRGLRRLSPGMDAVKAICRLTNGCNLYVPVISTLLQLGYAEDALYMHTFLLQEQHHPQSYQDIYPLLDYANKYGLQNDFQRLKKYTDERFPALGKPAVEVNPVADRQVSRANTGGLSAANSAGKRSFKDELGAKLFATAALGFDTVLSGMEMFGVEAIGPLSLREMGIRSHGSRDIQEKLQKFQKANVAIGNSVYARLLRKLAAGNRDILLSDLLRSDQHPDVFEDAEVQESLLVTNYMARDLRQYNLTLAVLTELLPAGTELSNIHFRKHIAAGELSFASKLVDDLTLRNESLCKKSIDYMVKRVLSVRRVGSAPAGSQNDSRIDGVVFVIRILQRTVPSGQHITPELWIELLKRLGMTGRFDDLRSCSLWLAQYYTSKSKYGRASQQSFSVTGTSNATQNALPADGAVRMRQSIFNAHMQSAIVSWGFKMRISNKPEAKSYNPFKVAGERLVPWTRGLVLLRELEREGVLLDVPWIRRSCRQRLAVLFGDPYLSAKPINRLLRRENLYSVETVLADINRAWGEPLFGDLEHGDIRRLVNPPRAARKESLRRRCRVRN